MKDVGQEVKKYDTNGGHLYKGLQHFPLNPQTLFLRLCC